MKLSKWGICSRSEGTGVVPSRNGSRLKCVLSKMMVTTWLISPRGELSWQLPAELEGAGAAVETLATARAAAGAAHADASGEIASSTAVPSEKTCRCQPAKPLVAEP